MGVLPGSLRGRLAGLFALGAAVLLALSALLVYSNVNSELTSAVDQGLEGRIADITTSMADGRLEIRPDEAFAQVIAPDGQVLAASTSLAGDDPVLTSSEIAAALRHSYVAIQRDVPGLGRHDRVLARSEPGPNGHPVVVAVGATIDTIRGAQRRLALVLLVSSPILIGALGAGAWLLTTVALRPVDRMSAEAETISMTQTGRRLPVPPREDEIAHLGQTLNTMLDRIESAFDHERRFVDDASHELRTPISILRNELELALLEHDRPEEVERALRSALEEADRLAQLANDLLVLARAREGQYPLHCEPVDLRATAERLTERMPPSEGPPIEVEGASSPAWADPQRIEQLITNLVDNARRHARGRVLVDISPDGDDRVVLRVADDGPGFAEGMSTSAFDRFTRAGMPRSHHHEHAGLGLAISATIVRAHGGEIEATNGPPLGGAVVTVTLPKAPDAE